MNLVNNDISHSWVRISHGLNKLVTDLIDKEYDDKEQETFEMKSELFALKTEVFASASRLEAKATPRRLSTTCSSTRTVPICERILADIGPGTQSNTAFRVSKRLTTLLRHGQLPREEDGASEFWRLKGYLRDEFEHSQYGSDEIWKSKMAGGTDSTGQEILYLRALQGHSGRNPIDLSLQDTVLIPFSSSTFHHIGCAVRLHSITNSGLIPGGQNLGKERQTVILYSREHHG